MYKNECDLTRLLTMCLNARIIWSGILMRRYWSIATNGKALETVTKRVNLLVRNLMMELWVVSKFIHVSVQQWSRVFPPMDNQKLT